MLVTFLEIPEEPCATWGDPAEFPQARAALQRFTLPVIQFTHCYGQQIKHMRPSSWLEQVASGT